MLARARLDRRRPAAVRSHRPQTRRRADRAARQSRSERTRKPNSARCSRPSPTSSGSRTSKGRYVRCNPPVRTCARHHAGRSDRQDRLRTFPRELADQHRAGDRRAIETGELQSRNTRRPGPDGRSSAFEVLKAPLRDESGATVGRGRDRSRRLGAPQESTSSFVSPPPRSRRRRASSSSTPTSGSCASTTPSSR